MQFSVCAVRLIRCPTTYFLQLSDLFDITTGKNIWAHYLENHFWALELLRLGYTLAISQTHIGTRSKGPSALLPAFSPSWLSLDIIQVRGLGEALQWGPRSRQRVPAAAAFTVCTPGTAPAQTLGAVTKVSEICWIWPWRALKVCGPWSFSHLVLTSQIIPVYPNLPSFSKLQIPLLNTLNSARSNSRKRFRQWNAKLRKVQRFLLIMGSQYHLNSRITWSFFLLKLDIYKIENPQCFSCQELSGKSLLYYR